MSIHLSQEQFARCFVGGATNEEQQHILSCAQCGGELEQFGESVSSLRQVIRERVEAQPLYPIPLPRIERLPRMRWALVAAAVLLVGTIPLLTKKPPQTIEEVTTESPEALMDAINTHLSRTIPSPMEPMMSLIPSEPSMNESGGIQ